MSTLVYVTNIPEACDSEYIKRYFNDIGRVRDCQVFEDSRLRKSVAYVKYNHSKHAKLAAHKKDSLVIDSAAIRVYLVWCEQENLSTVQVQNIPSNVSAKVLEADFSICGEVIDIRFSNNSNGARCAQISFSKVDYALQAVKEMNNSILYSENSLKVSMANPDARNLKWDKREAFEYKKVEAPQLLSSPSKSSKSLKSSKRNSHKQRKTQSPPLIPSKTTKPQPIIQPSLSVPNEANGNLLQLYTQLTQQSGRRQQLYTQLTKQSGRRQQFLRPPIHPSVNVSHPSNISTNTTCSSGNSIASSSSNNNNIQSSSNFMNNHNIQNNTGITFEQLAQHNQQLLLFQQQQWLQQQALKKQQSLSQTVNQMNSRNIINNNNNNNNISGNGNYNQLLTGIVNAAHMNQFSNVCGNNNNNNNINMNSLTVPRMNLTNGSRSLSSLINSPIGSTPSAPSTPGNRSVHSVQSNPIVQNLRLPNPTSSFNTLPSFGTTLSNNGIPSNIQYSQNHHNNISNNNIINQSSNINNINNINFSGININNSPGNTSSNSSVNLNFNLSGLPNMPAMNNHQSNNLSRMTDLQAAMKLLAVRGQSLQSPNVSSLVPQSNSNHSNISNGLISSNNGINHGISNLNLFPPSNFPTNTSNTLNSSNVSNVSNTARTSGVSSIDLQSLLSYNNNNTNNNNYNVMNNINNNNRMSHNNNTISSNVLNGFSMNTSNSTLAQPINVQVAVGAKTSSVEEKKMLLSGVSIQPVGSPIVLTPENQQKLNQISNSPNSSFVSNKSINNNNNNINNINVSNNTSFTNQSPSNSLPFLSFSTTTHPTSNHTFATVQPSPNPSSSASSVQDVPAVSIQSIPSLVSQSTSNATQSNISTFVTALPSMLQKQSSSSSSSSDQLLASKISSGVKVEWNDEQRCIGTKLLDILEKQFPHSKNVGKIVGYLLQMYSTTDLVKLMQQPKQLYSMFTKYA